MGRVSWLECPSNRVSAVPDNTPLSTTILHASCVAIDGKGLLISGKSGSGKSSLALQLMALGAQLVSDDRVQTFAVEGKLQATPLPEIAGKIEARGLGILYADHLKSVFIEAIVDMEKTESERLPELRTENILGVHVPCYYKSDTPSFPRCAFAAFQSRPLRMNATDQNSQNEMPVQTPRLVFVTGPSGGGRTTAINALEDMGYETIINLPLRYVTRLLRDDPPSGPTALGLDIRNRDFSVNAVLDILSELGQMSKVRPELVFVECSPDVLLRRYSETRRRHPMAEDDSPHIGIAAEIELLKPIRARADIVIETTEFSPHDLKAELNRWFGDAGSLPLAVSVQSFSYKRGIPAGMDLVFDCRFLRNPHWSPDLRAKTGQDSDVQAYIDEDPLYEEYFAKIYEMIRLILPAVKKEGRAHMTIGVGCTGGKHRSVAMAEKLGRTLEVDTAQVSIRHRELERRRTAAQVK